MVIVVFVCFDCFVFVFDWFFCYYVLGNKVRYGRMGKVVEMRFDWICNVLVYR